MPELKPCPFCGGKPFVQTVKDVFKCQWYSVQCRCGAFLHYENEREKVIEAWNRRCTNDK